MCAYKRDYCTNTFLCIYLYAYLFFTDFIIKVLVLGTMKDENLVGFPDLNEISDNDDNAIANIKKPKVSKKSGGFQSMALSFPVVKGILKKGYKIPTPIQRKVQRKQHLLDCKEH